MEKIMNIALSLFKAKNRFLGTISPAYAAKQARDLFLTPKRYPIKPWEENMELRGRRINAGFGLSAIVWGKSERRILIAHGWESRATQMSGFVDVLVARGFEVVALDGPAHGHSKGTRANPYLFAKAVAHAHKNLGPFERVIGHSMGGNAIATAMSEGMQCSKVVLISSPSSIDNVLKRFASFIGLPKLSGKQFIAMVEENVGKSTELLNTAENISKLAIKGLVIHDKSDIEIPYTEALEITRNWDGASLFATEGFGHRAIVRQPIVWEKTADFLA
jgi:esterase/lipase